MGVNHVITPKMHIGEIHTWVAWVLWLLPRCLVLYMVWN